MSTKQSDSEILTSLAAVYNEACDVKDYALCDRIRGAIDAVLRGRPATSGMIKIEEKLGIITEWD